MDELAELMVTRIGVTSVFDDFGIVEQGRKEELIRLFHMLISNGAGQWIGDKFIPTVVLYDVELLRLILQAERSGAERQTHMKKWRFWQLGMSKIAPLKPLKYYSFIFTRSSRRRPGSRSARAIRKSLQCLSTLD